MATLRVRNFPDPLYDRVQKIAEANGRSLDAEVIEILRRALQENPPSGEVLEKIRRRRSFNPSAAGAPDSSTLMRKDRDR